MITCPFAGCPNRIPDELMMCSVHAALLTPDERKELSAYREEWSRGAMDFAVYNGFLKQFVADARGRQKKLKTGDRP